MPEDAPPGPAGSGRGRGRSRRRPRAVRGPAGARLALPLLALALAAGACGTDETDSRSETAGLPGLRERAEDDDWVLDHDDSTPTIPDTGTPVTLEIDGERISGRGPCNSFHGEVHIDGEDVEIGDLGVTMMACDGPVEEAEAAFLDALRAVDSGDVDGDRLELTGPDVRLVFDADDDDTEDR